MIQRSVSRLSRQYIRSSKHHAASSTQRYVATSTRELRSRDRQSTNDLVQIYQKRLSCRSRAGNHIVQIKGYHHSPSRVPSTWAHWYAKWEERHREQYEHVVRLIDRDPYFALFGASNQWLGWYQVPSSRTQDHKASMSQKIKKNADARHVSEAEIDIAKYHARPNIQQKEYIIDPITLRKIPQNAGKTTQDAEKPHDIRSRSEAHDIPVKIWRASNSSIDVQLDAFMNNSSKPLRKEQNSSNLSKSPEIEKAGNGDHAATKQFKVSHKENLDKDTQSCKRDVSPKMLANEIEADKTEDLDLLRASDIRAAAGLRGRKSKIAKQVEKAARMQNLSNSYKDHADALSEKLATEIRRPQSFSRQDLSNDRTTESVSGPGRNTTNPNFDPVHRFNDNLHSSASLFSRLGREQAKLKDETKDQDSAQTATRVRREIKQQRENGREITRPVEANTRSEDLRGEGDIALNVHEFANRHLRPGPKAGALSQADSPSERLAQIYADTYGVQQNTTVPFATQDVQYLQRDRPSALVRSCDLLSIEKAISSELRSLQFVLDADSVERPLGIEHGSGKLSQLREAAQRCSDVLLHAARQIRPAEGYNTAESDESFQSPPAPTGLQASQRSTDLPDSGPPSSPPSLPSTMQRDSSHGGNGTHLRSGAEFTESLVQAEADGATKTSQGQKHLNQGHQKDEQRDQRERTCDRSGSSIIRVIVCACAAGSSCYITALLFEWARQRQQQREDAYRRRLAERHFQERGLFLN